MPPTETVQRPAARTHCPTCGMKIARDDLSICSYCSAPLHLAVGRTPSAETAKRLAKMVDHKGYADALAHQPPESAEVHLGKRELKRAPFLALAGVVAGALFLRRALGPEGSILSLWAPVALVLLVLAVRSWRSGRARVDKNAALPLLKRPALVLERRSETILRGYSGETVYYFQLEFEDGAVAEFRSPGKGASHDPLVNGNTGIAYTRGSELLDFQVLKV